MHVAFHMLARRSTWRWTRALCLLWALIGCHGIGTAGEVTAAVASNFADTAERLGEAFAAQTGDELVIVKGSTGKLAAQSLHGAPFHLLLAADEEHARLLVEAGQAVADTRFTYAIGRLVLWSADPSAIGDDGPAAIKAATGRLAIANPRLAPYGAAALQVLDSLGLTERFAGRIVQGENIGQAFGMVASGGAGLGFVALSQLVLPQFHDRGSSWLVPSDLHQPIRQDAVLLKHGADHAPARRFMDFLTSKPARQIIAQAGYELAED